MKFRKQQPTQEVLRCSFCNKSQRDVAKLIAGPSVYICVECVEICNQIVAEEIQLGQKPGPVAVPDVPDTGELGMPVRCGLCRMLWPAERSVSFPDRGWLCEPCLDNVRLYLDSSERPAT